MKLRDWRTGQNLSIETVAEMLGVPRTVRTLLRVERGEVKADADLVERIREISDGAVTPDDMHQTRLEWLAARDGDASGEEGVLHAAE